LLSRAGDDALTPALSRGEREHDREAAGSTPSESSGSDHDRCEGPVREMRGIGVRSRFRTMIWPESEVWYEIVL